MPSFPTPRHPAEMRALLEHSVQSYGHLPSELRPHRVRSRTSSQPSPYAAIRISKTSVLTNSSNKQAQVDNPSKSIPVLCELPVCSNTLAALMLDVLKPAMRWSFLLRSAMYDSAPRICNANCPTYANLRSYEYCFPSPLAESRENRVRSLTFPPPPLPPPSSSITTTSICIDPQLVDTPSAVTDHGQDDSDNYPHQLRHKKSQRYMPPILHSSFTSAKAATTTATAQKSHKGTVSLPRKRKGKHRSRSRLLWRCCSQKDSRPNMPKTRLFPPARPLHLLAFTVSQDPKSSFLSTIPTAPKRAPSVMSADMDDDDDSELPQDWRPWMTNKEKRQLRNKISARNFGGRVGIAL